jgi:hypothetical protein
MATTTVKEIIPDNRKLTRDIKITLKVVYMGNAQLKVF